MLIARSMSVFTCRFVAVLSCLLAFQLGAGDAALAGQTPPAGPATLRLTILHDNDTHGHLLPFDYQEVAAYPPGTPIDSVPEMDSVGGAARRATLIRHLKAQMHNPVLVIDSGDIATRGPFATTYEGLPDVAAMNAIGYDMAEIGNNEFKLKDGVDQTDSAGAQADLLQLIKLSRFPWLCANALDANGDPLQGVQPYLVRSIDGVRVGFLGLTAPRSAKYPQIQGWSVGDPIAAAKRWIPEARKHCDILIAVTHIGVDLDKELAAQTSGIDAIVGGDSHTYLYRQLLVKSADGRQVPIVQAGEYGVRLGRFDLLFVSVAAYNGVRYWRLERSSDVLIPVSARIPQAPDVAAVLQPFAAPLKGIVAGRLPFAVASTPKARLTQSNQLIADAMRVQTQADVALNPSEIDMYSVFHDRVVTRYDILSVLPYHDDVVVAAMTGTRIQKIVSGGKDGVLASGDLAALSPGATYKVAMLDYIAANVYKVPASQITATGRDVRAVVAAYLGQSPEAARVETRF